MTEDDDAFITGGAPIGSPCCADPKRDGPNKVAAAMCNYTLAARWEVAAVNRWCYITKVWRRQVLLGMIDDSLREMLRAVQAHSQLDFSLEAQLARVIALEADNYAAKNKLRLIRLCKVLLPTDSIIEMAVGIVATAALETLHHATLGHDKRGRLLLRELVDPSLSPICTAQQSIVELLDSFDVEEGRWVLLRCLGVNFRCPRLRVLARGACVRASTGLLHYFEKRLSGPMPNLINLLPDVLAPRTAKLQIASDFLNTPAMCLPLGAQRLQRACSDVASVADVVYSVVSVLAERAVISTDLSERIHAQVRQDLKTETQNRSFESSSDRTFCRQLRTAHMNCGGDDPVLCLAPLADSDVAPHAGGLRGGRLSRHGGSAKLRHRNNKLRAFKEVHAPTRPLTREELDACVAAADAEWSLVCSDPEQFDAWVSLTRCSKAGGRSLEALADRQENMYAPLWMEGAERRCLVSPEEIAKLGSRGDDGGVASPHETATASGKFVDVARKRTAADGDGWWPLLGCHTREKNVCRTHGAISAHMANQLDGLVALFNAWMMSIGKQSANTVDHFALLHSGDGRHKRIVMLSDCVWSPRCQIFTRCHLPTVDRDTFSVMPAFPFRFTIGASRGSCRLGGQGFC